MRNFQQEMMLNSKSSPWEYKLLCASVEGLHIYGHSIPSGISTNSCHLKVNIQCYPTFDCRSVLENFESGSRAGLREWSWLLDTAVSSRS